jgi:hypothetical protein
VVSFSSVYIEGRNLFKEPDRTFCLVLCIQFRMEAKIPFNYYFLSHNIHFVESRPSVKSPNIQGNHSSDSRLSSIKAWVLSIYKYFPNMNHPRTGCTKVRSDCVSMVSMILESVDKTVCCSMHAVSYSGGGPRCIHY